MSDGGRVFLRGITPGFAWWPTREIRRSPAPGGGSALATTQTLRVHFPDLDGRRTSPHEGGDVLNGSGHSLHWDVTAEIADKYYARMAKVPT
jgi:hypothetical protein